MSGFVHSSLAKVEAACTARHKAAKDPATVHEELVGALGHCRWEHALAGNILIVVDHFREIHVEILVRALAEALPHLQVLLALGPVDIGGPGRAGELHIDAIRREIVGEDIKLLLELGFL